MVAPGVSTGLKVVPLMVVTPMLVPSKWNAKTGNSFGWLCRT
jgi:hypothetical protein